MNRRAGIAAPHAAHPIASDDDFSAGEVLVEGVRAWLTQLPAYAGVALIVHLPLFLLLPLARLPGWMLLAIFLAAEYVVALLVKGALVRAVLDARRGFSSDFRELLEALVVNAPAAVGLGIQILWGAAVRALKLVLPGVAWLCETFAAIPEAIAEDSSASAALRRSEQLIEGARLRVFLLCAAIWTLAIALPVACGVQEGGSLITVGWMVAYLCTRALDTSLAAVLSATAYAHLLQRPQA